MSERKREANKKMIKVNKEREGEREKQEREDVYVCACVCVHVSVREREKETFTLGAFVELTFCFSDLAISPTRPDCQHEKH